MGLPECSCTLLETTPLSACSPRQAHTATRYSVGTLNLERRGKLSQMGSRLEVLLPRTHSIGSRGHAPYNKSSRNQEDQGSHSRSRLNESSPSFTLGNHWEGLLPRVNHGSSSARRARELPPPGLQRIKICGTWSPRESCIFSVQNKAIELYGSSGVRLLGFKPQLSLWQIPSLCVLASSPINWE